MQIELSLSHLNPLCQHIIIIVDLIRQFSNIFVTLRSPSFRLVFHGELIYFVDHPIDKWRDTRHERDSCPLFQVSFLIALYVYLS